MAVKVLPPTKAEDPVSLGRFYREARVASGLDHPHIVHTYDIDQDGPLHFLVMEYVDGTTLLDIVKKTGPLSIVRACHYIRQACIGLDTRHRSGMIHRDIKPGNIILDRHGVARLLDMGLARFYQDEQDQLTLKYDDKNVLGTADYVAPEQTKDSRKIDIRADIYGMGASFYFVLTGQPPFPEATLAEKLVAHQTKKPRPIRELRSDIPAGIAKIIEKMMAKAPADRYQTPQEIVAALELWTATPIDPPPAAEMPKLSPAAADTHFSGTPVLATTPLDRDASHVRPDEVMRSRSTSSPMLNLSDLSEAAFESAATVPVPPLSRLPAAPIPSSGSVVDLVSPFKSRPASTLPKPPEKTAGVETRSLTSGEKTPPPARLAPEEGSRLPKPAPPEAPKLPPELARLTRSKVPDLFGTRPPSVEPPRKSLSDLRLPTTPESPRPAEARSYRCAALPCRAWPRLAGRPLRPGRRSRPACRRPNHSGHPSLPSRRREPKRDRAGWGVAPAGTGCSVAGLSAPDADAVFRPARRTQPTDFHGPPSPLGSDDDDFHAHRRSPGCRHLVLCTAQEVIPGPASPEPIRALPCRIGIRNDLHGETRHVRARPFCRSRSRQAPRLH